MKGTKYSHQLLWLIFLFLFVPLISAAEPCILSYPDGNVIFHFDPSKYMLIYPDDPRYDPAYDRYGAVLWDMDSDRIAYELYQAPGLQGFEPGYIEKNVFNFPSNSFTMYVDGFYHMPRRLSNIYVRFLPTPGNAEPTIYVNDVQVTGLAYYIPQLIVSTPTGNGFYSGTISLDIVWTGAEAMKITVYADKNGNRVFDGIPCFSIFMQDQTIPAENSTWGQIKARYQ